MTPEQIAIATAAAAAFWWIKRQKAQAQDMSQAGDVPEYEYTPAQPEYTYLAEWSGDEMTPQTDETQAAANVRAFLRMIRRAEGTDNPKGYQTMFGYRYFSDFSDHPRNPAQFTDNKGVRKWTSAAGAYQFMAISQKPDGTYTKVDTWDRVAARLGLPDFSPASQDAAAVELIREAGALGDVRAGRFAVAVGKVRRIWASMPGAGYDQPEKTMASLQAAYLQAGGALA